MRAIFMGAPPFAVPTLETLVSLAAEVAAVYTKAPRPGGRRGLEIRKTAVQEKAEALGLPVLTPVSLRNDGAAERLRAFAPDLAIVAAYGLILPPKVLEIPKLGCVNLHASLLPRWRGAAPIQRAIMEGDAETGVGLMRMEAGLDTGPVAREMRTLINPTDTSSEMTDRLSRMAADLLAICWSELIEGRLVFREQSADGVLYANKIDKTEAILDWTQDAARLRNLIHGLSPWPGAYSEIGSAGARERVKFLRVEAASGRGAPGEILSDDFLVACGEGGIRVHQAQRAGKGVASGEELMRGGRFAIGDAFASAEDVRSAHRAGA